MGRTSPVRREQARVKTDMSDFRYHSLSIVLAVTGVAFVLLYPVTLLFPESWLWEPRQREYEQMLIGVYFVLGIFAIIAARNPLGHLSLIWFIATSNIVHGGIMLVQALVDTASEWHNLYGDIPALIITGLLIAILAPRRLSAGRLSVRQEGFG